VLSPHLVVGDLTGKMRASYTVRFAYMVDHIVDASKPRGRVDIQVGAGRRRRWSDEAKGRIVAQSYAPGAVVSEVARRHGISPQHLFAWRKAARAGLLGLPADEAPLFVPVVPELRSAGTAAEAASGSSTAIIIEIGGVVVRAAAGVDPAWLRDVLRAVRAAT
jgi:transposase